MLDEIEFASEKGSIGKMTGIQKLMMACFVIGSSGSGLLSRLLNGTSMSHYA